MTTHPHDKNPDQELQDFMASLDADFGKKAKKGKTDNDIARERNKAFHEQNPRLEPAGGRAPELDMSGNWVSTARVTYVIRQCCATCNNTVEFIGGEFILFESKRQHAKVLRRAEHCPNHWLFDEDDEPLESLVDEFDQTVSRCPGCIAVERRAEQLWDLATKNGEQPELPEVVESEKKNNISTGLALKAMLHREFGTKFKQPKPSQELNIDLGE